jgi:hypothetical protein
MCTDMQVWNDMEAFLLWTFGILCSVPGLPIQLPHGRIVPAVQMRFPGACAGKWLTPHCESCTGRQPELVKCLAHRTCFR